MFIQRQDPGDKACLHSATECGLNDSTNFLLAMSVLISVTEYYSSCYRMSSWSRQESRWGLGGNCGGAAAAAGCGGAAAAHGRRWRARPPPATPPASLHALRRLSRGGTRLRITGRANVSSTSQQTRWPGRWPGVAITAGPPVDRRRQAGEWCPSAAAVGTKECCGGGGAKSTEQKSTGLYCVDSEVVCAVTTSLLSRPECVPIAGRNESGRAVPWGFRGGRHVSSPRAGRLPHQCPLTPRPAR